MFANPMVVLLALVATAAVAAESDVDKAQPTGPLGPDCHGATCEAQGDVMLQRASKAKVREHHATSMRDRGAERTDRRFDPEYAAMHFKSTCPAVGAVIKNGDLVPDCSSGVCLIDKRMTRQAFLISGISVKTATETTDANFKSEACPTCPDKMDPFAMNSIDCGSTSCKGGSPADQPHEHFRSTGVRDGPKVDVARYDWIEKNCLGSSGATWFLSNIICFADSTDCEQAPCQSGPVAGSAALYERMLSNDIDEPKRPRKGGTVCSEAHSGPEACPSQLHGSITTMFQEFAHPAGPWGTLSRAEQRALWVEGEYPASFSKRSPSFCMAFTGDEAGCSACRQEVDGSSPDAYLLAERYCRCMHSQELSEATLAASEEYQCICQKAANGACDVQIEPIHAITGHYAPDPMDASGQVSFNATQFFLGKAQCSSDRFGINFCSDWCNVAGVWPDCGTHSLPGVDARNTDNEDYECSCLGCNSCQQCSSDKFGINFCSDWCNVFWPGCGSHTLLATDARNTDNVDYTCSCMGCNGCEAELASF